MSNLKIRTNAKTIPSCQQYLLWGRVLLFAMFFGSGRLLAAESANPQNLSSAASASRPNGFNVQAYVVEGRILLSSNCFSHAFAKHPAGTNVSLREIVLAASDLQMEYKMQGYPTMNIVIAPKRIANGICTMNVFQGAVAQIVVAGKHFSVTTNNEVLVVNPPFAGPGRESLATLNIFAEDGTNSTSAKSVATTNGGPRFAVEKYVVLGNSILSPEVIGQTLTNIPSAFGTNVTLDGIRSAVIGLRGAYRERGYVTVDVGVPAGQRLDTNHPTIKLQVTEGRLASIAVKGNHYFSSNNVMRTLPSLHTNTILNGLIFQAELNQANANQDRQIYPIIGPGTEPGTSDLTLKVKDRLPLHGKVELNNQNSPGTPGLRINSSAMYNNLWQEEHSLGLQYSFSPELFKQGDQWEAYDKPLVANYSGFYRMPIGVTEAVENIVADNPGSFGYNEGTHKFTLPPASGQPELNFYASRSTIDTGLETLSEKQIYKVTGVREITRKEVQQDFTVNNNVGVRFSTPLTQPGGVRSGLSSSLDYKSFEITSYKTNSFRFAETTLDIYGNPNPPTYSTVVSPTPTTHRLLDYLPFSVRYDVSLPDPMGTTTFGLGINVNAWYSGSTSDLQAITDSSKSSGHWVVMTPSFSRSLELVTNWVTTIRADGQWATEPLISNEQFGAGGVNSVRGYKEGEVFGDTGWHVSLEQQSPPHRVGMIAGRTPLLIRGSLYTDYAKTYLIDPHGRPDGIDLWGAGLGGVASIGSHWETRLLLSVPLLRTVNTRPYQPFLNFSITGQF